MSSILGTWVTELKAPTGAQTATLTISDGPASVQVTESNEDEVPVVEDVRIDGDTATFAMKVTKPMKLTVKWTLTAEGDTLSGKAKAGMFPAFPVTGTRA